MYACIADVLGMMAVEEIRGGPAANILQESFCLVGGVYNQDKW